MKALRWLGAPFLWLALQVMLLLLGLGSLLWNAVALVLYPLLSRETGRRVGRAGIAAGYRLFWVMARAGSCGAGAAEPSAAIPRSSRRSTSSTLEPIG